MFVRGVISGRRSLELVTLRSLEDRPRPHWALVVLLLAVRLIVFQAR